MVENILTMRSESLMVKCRPWDITFSTKVAAAVCQLQNLGQESLALKIKDEYRTGLARYEN
jgi:hypothetical protein